ncbi:hypothetical protein LEP1GSC047_2462 [Leptospira inadai serovar Lyme str. 10]|uniref:Uncharacterized protein n=1 Tax=Leptospira inadai serovar Lyme str. 10 TaxID=1049790 RepID=V6HEV4_9LEPT|nr:hypothetical protein LEP1GSC047_2462 [Leptospira inadai serovar Lyme str. 10]
MGNLRILLLEGVPTGGRIYKRFDFRNFFRSITKSNDSLGHSSFEIGRFQCAKRFAAFG